MISHSGRQTRESSPILGPAAAAESRVPEMLDSFFHSSSLISCSNENRGISFIEQVNPLSPATVHGTHQSIMALTQSQHLTNIPQAVGIAAGVDPSIDPALKQQAIDYLTKVKDLCEETWQVSAFAPSESFNTDGRGEEDLETWWQGCS